MTAFKPGDRVLIRATVERALDLDVGHLVEFDSGRRFYIRPDELEPAPEPPYVDPELVPGMVVMPLDERDRRLWFVEDETADCKTPPPYLIGFRDVFGEWFSRPELPDEIRPVFDPREVTT